MDLGMTHCMGSYRPEENTQEHLSMPILRLQCALYFGKFPTDTLIVLHSAEGQDGQRYN